MSQNIVLSLIFYKIQKQVKLSNILFKHTYVFPKLFYFCFIDYAKAFDCVDHNKLWKILKEMGIPDHLTCLLRNLYAGQEATLRTGHGTTDWFQIGKGVHQGCILSPCLFNFYAEYIIKRSLLLGRRVKTNLDSIFKSRDIILATKVRLWFFLWSCMDVRVGHD